LYEQSSPAVVHGAPLSGAAPGQVAPPLLLLPTVVPVVVVTVAPPTPMLVPVVVGEAPPTPVVVMGVVPVDVAPVPPGPVVPTDAVVVAAPVPAVVWLTEPPQASMMARTAIPREAMATVLFMSLSKLWVL
jgi:hypothetical protein